MRKINFDIKWWLKWYWPHIEKIYEIEGHYGTRQSGKTHQIGRKLIRHSFLPKQFNVVHARKEYNKIEGSTFKILCDIINKDFKDDFIIKKDHFQIINKHTGNWFRGLGMDKAENAKSIEGANIAWMNEANQFSLDDYDYIDTTIRGNLGVEISMILDWNPQSISHWLKAESDSFATRPNCVLIKSTFWQNYLIDREALNQKLLKIKSRGKSGEALYKVWALGDWGVEDTDKLFIRNFDRLKHVGTPEYDEDYDLFLAWDLNYDPVCHAVQLLENGFVVLKSYGAKGIVLPYVCAQIKNDYPEAFFQINGDASGHHSRNLTDNSTSYEIIKQCLGISWSQFNVPKANPSHKRSRIQCNALFDFGTVIIHEQCEDLIKDIESAIVDENGSLDKWKKDNPALSHWLDPIRYHANSEHQEFFKTIDFEQI